MDKMTPEYKSAREKIKVIVKESGLPEMGKYALLTTCLAEIAHEYNNTITHTYDQPAPYGKTKPSVQVEPKFRKGDKVKIVDEIVKTFGNVATITHCEVDDGKVFYWLNDDIGCYYEYQLGPYTEPETKDAYEQYREAKAEEYKNQLKDMEEKELNLCELLKGCEKEEFYCHYLRNNVKFIGFDEHDGMTFILSLYKNGLGYENLMYIKKNENIGKSFVLYPSKELYEKYPLDPVKAWEVWASERKSKYSLEIKFYPFKDKKMLMSESEEFELQVHSLEEAQQAAEAVRETLMKFHELNQKQ